MEDDGLTVSLTTMSVILRVSRLIFGKTHEIAAHHAHRLSSSSASLWKTLRSGAWSSALSHGRRQAGRRHNCGRHRGHNQQRVCHESPRHGGSSAESHLPWVIPCTGQICDSCMVIILENYSTANANVVAAHRVWSPCRFRGTVAVTDCLGYALRSLVRFC